LIDDVTRIESVLSAYARPVFLAITKPDENNDIRVVLSSIAFKTMSIGQRISYVFNLIKTHIPDTLNERLIVVQAYSPDELEEALEALFIPALFEKET
jgi:hypothetical protein